MATRIIVAEANTDAPKPLRGAPDGSGYRDMARSESSAQELGRPADGKPTAGVGRVRSSGEAGNDRGAKGLHTKSVSNNEAVTRLPPKRRMTQEQIASIAARHHLTKHPDIALRRERLAIKARAERKFRFYILFDFVTEYETLLCAWEHVKANGGAPGVDGVTIQMIGRSEGVTGKMAGKTFRAKALNTGDASLKAADCTVDDAGNVFATPVPTGLLLMVR